MLTQEYIAIIILALIILVLVTRDNSCTTTCPTVVAPPSGQQSVEGMINVSKADPLWNRTKCGFYMNKTMRNVLDKNKMTKDKKNWNFYFPCGYDYINREIYDMPVKDGARYFIIDNADQITAKNLLWDNIVAHHGYEKAKLMSPDTFVLSRPSDVNRMKSLHHNGKLYIMKKNIQRQEGLLISDDLDGIIKNKDNYILAQELLQNPYTVGGRKINLRVYVLVVCHKHNMDVYVYNDGFMYYTKDKFVKGNKTSEKNVTTGYVDRWVYKVNPLTHQDFKKYLDKLDRKLECSTEAAIRSQGYDISDVVFHRIKRLMADIFVSFKGKICRKGKKLCNNVTYQLFGADVAISDELQPTIMEINKGPDLSPKDERDAGLKFNVVNDAHRIVGALSDRTENGFDKVLDMEDGQIVFSY